MRIPGRVVLLTLALVSACAGGDDGVPADEGNSLVGMACSPVGQKNAMLANTAMDPCPQDMCPNNPAVPDPEYVTILVCTEDMATHEAKWACQCQGVCGNGHVEQGEACDGDNLNGMSCSELGKSGVVTCNATCTGFVGMCMSSTGTAGTGG